MDSYNQLEVSRESNGGRIGETMQGVKTVLMHP